MEICRRMMDQRAQLISDMRGIGGDTFAGKLYERAIMEIFMSGKNARYSMRYLDLSNFILKALIIAYTDVGKNYKCRRE